MDPTLRGAAPARQEPHVVVLVRIERWVAAVALYLTYASNEAPRFGLAAYGDLSRVVGAPASAGS